MRDIWLSPAYVHYSWSSVFGNTMQWITLKFSLLILAMLYPIMTLCNPLLDLKLRTSFNRSLIERQACSTTHRVCSVIYDRSSSIQILWSELNFLSVQHNQLIERCLWFQKIKRTNQPFIWFCGFPVIVFSQIRPSLVLSTNNSYWAKRVLSSTCHVLPKNVRLYTVKL